MAKSVNQKLKLLYILKYLMEETDENHSVTTKEIIAFLNSYDISAERKSIYDDIDQLTDFGYDILKTEERSGGYYMASRDFELAELKILVDLVQSSKFITTTKSRELISKLEKLASKDEAKQLQRQVVVTDRNKTINERIYYNVDDIYRAMGANEKIRFQYYDWDINKKMIPRKEGKYYEVSPWGLTWDEEKYYLMAYDEEAETIKHYRVDKMTNLSLAGSIRKGKAAADKIDVASISKKNFGMFAGEEKTVQLKVPNDYVGIIIDRFGTDVAIRPLDEEHVLCRTNIAISDQFFGWLAGLGNIISIYSPEDLRESYKAHLQSIIDEM